MNDVDAEVASDDLIVDAETLNDSCHDEASVLKNVVNVYYASHGENLFPSHFYVENVLLHVPSHALLSAWLQQLVAQQIHRHRF